jgi:hypothetical protein
MMTETEAQPLNPIQLINRADIKIVSNDPMITQLARVKLIPSTTKLTLHLDTLNLTASTISKSSLQRNKILLVIPLAVPQGKKLLIHSLTEVGTSNIRKTKAAVTLHSEVFLAGSTGIIVNHSSKIVGNKILSLTSRKTISSACGQSSILRLNKSIISKGVAKISSHRSSIVLSLEDC